MKTELRLTPPQAKNGSRLELLLYQLRKV